MEKTHERQADGRTWCFQKTRSNGIAALPSGGESQKRSRGSDWEISRAARGGG